MEVVRGIWPVMISLFLSGTVGIMVFPFFTYVPSSGWLKDLLPKASTTFAHWLPALHGLQQELGDLINVLELEHCNSGNLA